MKVNNYDWNEIQKFHDEKHCFVEIYKKFSVCRTVLFNAIEKGLFIKKEFPKLHSIETKKKCSEKRKKWLKDNPDKHVWKRKEKNNSVPCEIFKEQLKKMEINFYPEFTPLENRAFSIDIAFPNEKIGIEINGNQHYEKDGKLKLYYQERHNLIEAEGWKLHEIPCAMVWNNEFVENLILSLTGKIDPTFDYQLMIDEYNKKRLEKITCACGNKKLKDSKNCRKCSEIEKSLKQRKVERPGKEELEKLVNENSYVKLGKQFGVSDNTIKQWCRDYNIELKKRINKI